MSDQVDRLVALRAELAAKTDRLARRRARWRPGERARLAEDVRRLEAAVAEAEGASLTGAGWERP